MKKIIVIMCYLITMINIQAEDVNKEHEIKVSVSNDDAKLSNILIVAKLGNRKDVIAEFVIDKNIDVKHFFYDNSFYYLLLYSNFFFKTNRLLLLKYNKEKYNKREIKFNINDSIEVYPPYLSGDGSYLYEQVNNDIYLKRIVTVFFDDFTYTRFVFDNCAEIWIPINDNNEEIYEDARSAIKNWFYNGNLKRWYPENRRGEIDKEIWFEQTPTTELRNYPMKLWSKEDKGEEINYPEEYKKKFSEERERLRLEEEKRITEEKQKLQQKIFITLGILFLVILGGFLIKRLKKKRIIKDTE